VTVPKFIHDQLVECTENACDWYGIVSDCLPDVDGQGTIGCPLCQAAVGEIHPDKASEGAMLAQGGCGVKTAEPCPDCGVPMILHQHYCEPGPVEFFWACDNFACGNVEHWEAEA
jgi:hypothetical protein